MTVHSTDEGQPSASEPQSSDAEGLAPVIPLFGARSSAAVSGRNAHEPEHRAAPAAWHTTWNSDRDDAEGDPVALLVGGEVDDSTADEIERAERELTRKLRTRQLSVSEARAAVAARSLEPATIDAILHRFCRLGYLDDTRLAEQLVHAGAERKGHGRQVIAQTLAKRRIPREVIDAALAELPDDDAERALEFARQKARSLRDLDRDTAVRRLAGQLARRGYGTTALDAARRALDEQSGSARPSGVRFTEE